MTDLPPITNIRRYRYRPGDRIIVRINQRLSEDEARHAQETVADVLGIPRISEVLVLDSGADIKVLRNTSDPEDRARLVGGPSCQFPEENGNDE